jgi:hypothetical protein
MGCRPIPQAKWRYSVAQKDLYMLEPLLDVVQWLLCGGLTGVNLLWTIISHRVQPIL